ncbi:hypothetical protein [Blautia luti]|uniref:hypothetical protein n=1 Tax=Blautia luti TaxID=89014 RepID=UPI003D7B519E
MVKDRASFVEYIAFVLGDDYVASMLEGKQMGESGFFANSSDAMPALYEKMLKTSVEGPERIKDIGYVLKMVSFCKGWHTGTDPYTVSCTTDNEDSDNFFHQ